MLADGMSCGKNLVTHIRSRMPQSLRENQTVIRSSAFVIGPIEDEDGEAVQWLHRGDSEWRQRSEQDRAREQLGVGLQDRRRHDCAVGKADGDRTRAQPMLV